MGLTSSKINKGEIIDFISTHYILTMNFCSLRKLFEKDYCNELIILISEIIMDYLSVDEIINITKRVKYGGNMDDIDDMNDMNDLNNIKDYSIYISKFYVKIAHIYSVILVTLNPEYIYNDNYGRIIKRRLTENENVPDNAIIEKINYDLKNTKINELNLNTQNPYLDISEDGNEEIEYSIPEFIELYYDSGYDVNTGNFMDMSENAKNQFKEELLMFYKAFTESEDDELPKDIKKFSDIKLNKYFKSENCNNLNNYEIKNKLFEMYGNKLKHLLININNTQHKLLDFLNKIFIYEYNYERNNEIIRINPKLTDNILQTLITGSRTIIIELYIKSDLDFAECIQIYEAIVEMKLLDTLQSQVIELEKNAEKLYYF